MGRSKFPGKPSKLVTKKRVSVLNNQSNNNVFIENNDELDNEDPNSDQFNELNNLTDNKFISINNASPTSNSNISSSGSSIASVAITTTTILQASETATKTTTEPAEALLLHTTKNAKNSINTHANDAQVTTFL